MRRIYSAATLPDAHLVRGLLLQAGIDARVFNENAQGAMGEIPFHQAWPEVWIMDDAQSARARDLIRQIEGPAPGPGGVFCSRCHEENPVNFQVCWHCGAEI